MDKVTSTVHLTSLATIDSSGAYFAGAYFAGAYLLGHTLLEAETCIPGCKHC